MNKEQFTVELINELKKRLGNDFDVISNITLKTNGLKLTGLIISKDSSFITPNIYIDRYFNDYQCGNKSMADIVEAVLICYYTVPPMEGIEQKLLAAYADCKNRIRCRLINTEMNRELLQTVPHREWNNLSIVYYLLLDEDDSSRMSTTIDYRLQKRLGLSEEELFETALNNIDSSVISMTNYLLENDVIGEEDIVEDNLFSLYIAGTKTGTYGAVSILKPNLLKDFAKKLCADILYLIPSSLHEMLILKPKKFVSVDAINDMIHCINQTQVMAEDVLSNVCYRYDLTNNRISVA